MGLMSNNPRVRSRAIKRYTEGKGLIVDSIEAPHFYGTDRRLPKPPIDERVAEATKTAMNQLVRVEVPEDLSMSCFEEINPEGEAVGRIWVRREPIETILNENHGHKEPS